MATYTDKNHFNFNRHFERIARTYTKQNGRKRVNGKLSGCTFKPIDDYTHPPFQSITIAGEM